jgi:hypothetical protein
MKEVPAYNVKTRTKTTIKNPELITFKNGKNALKGIAADDGKTTLYRIISAKDAEDFKAVKYAQVQGH